MSFEKRSPIKSPPPRVAGQSLDEELHRMRDEEVAPWIAFAVMVAFVAVIEWVRWIFDIAPHPGFFSVLALIIVFWCIQKAKVWKKRLHAIDLGLKGEREVGSILDSLRANGCRVIHDFIGDNFNVDHIVICDRGVFVIETKCVSKPSEGKPKVHFDGEKITIDGVGDYSKAATQAMAEARWLADLCHKLIGERLKIRPIVAFPGWYIEQSRPVVGPESPWVVNPKGIEKFISNSPVTLNASQITAIEGHLRLYLQNHPSSQP